MTNMKNENNEFKDKQGKKEKENKNKAQKKSSKKSLIFLGIMILIYVILYFLYPEKTFNAILYVIEIIKEILPILLFVYVFMVAFAFINEKKLKEYIQKAPMFVKYILLSLLGTLSHGPIYAWYPLLKELNQKGISKGAIGTFLYSRGIKLTLLPMLVSFFDLKYAIILTITTLIFSLIEGIVIDLTCKN